MTTSTSLNSAQATGREKTAVSSPRWFNLNSTYVWIFITAIPLLGIMWFAIFQPILVLPRMGLGPGFALMDQTGSRLTNEDVRGQITLYNFTYTSCQAPCPETTTAMAAIHRAIPTMNTRDIPVSIVTISFDPNRDTPEQLQTFAQRFIAPSATTAATVPWYFVTGEAMPLKYIIGGGFGTYYNDNEDGTFTFDPTFVLVDGAGIMRAKYRTATPDLEIVQRDIELIAKEAAESTGATKLAYEAAHLFLCYPK